MTKVAIVILNWNGSAMLQKFLPTLIKHSSTDGVDIIVADNHSTDDSLQVMQANFPQIRTIVLEDNYGFAGGYNKALQQVDAEYYLLLNSDIEVTEGWLQPMVEYMDAHSDVAACQPKLIDYKDPVKFEYAGGAGGYMDRWGYMYCRGRVFDTIETDNGQYNNVASLFWATGACLLVRSADYWGVGGLDDKFFAHQEEIDLCWRLRSRDRGIVAIPQSRVMHVGGATLSSSNPYKTFLNFRNNLLLLYKNLPERELRTVMFVRFWLDLVAALVFLLKLETGNFKAVFKARGAYRKMKPEFAEKRAENLSKAVLTKIPERSGFLLIWQYHILRKRTFTALHSQD